MSDATRKDRVGRGVATLFAVGGWMIFAVGIGLATLGAVGAEGVAARIVAAAPGLGLGLFGLFSVLVAIQTRAALDTADMTAEMLRLAQKAHHAPARPVSAGAVPAVEPPARAAAPELPSLSRPASGPVKPVTDPPVFGPRLTAPTRPAASGPKVHPIFSARPPR